MRNLRQGIPAGAPRYPDGPGLADAVSRLGRASLLVVGDAMLDRYVYGQLGHNGADAGSGVLAVEREVALPGGAANVVRNLTALGASVAFVSVVGDDQAGSDLTGLIGGQPGVEPWLLVEGGRTTTLRTRYLAQGRPLLRADQEETGPIQPKLAERLLKIARDAMAATTATVLADYGKGVLTGDTPEQLIAAARQGLRPVIVLPHGPDYARYAGADIIVVTTQGLTLADGLSLESDTGVAAAASNLRQQHGFGAVVVLRAEAGMTLVDAEGVHHYPADPTEAAEIASVGDSVLATLAAGLAVGLATPLASRLASVAADVMASKSGTAVVAADSDLLQALAL